MKKDNRIASSLIAALMLAASSACGINYYWEGTVDSDWQNPANWRAPDGVFPINDASCYTNNLYVVNTANDFPLVYTEAEGTTWMNSFQIQGGEFIVNGGTIIVTNSANTVSTIGNINVGGSMTLNDGSLICATWESVYINANSIANHCVLTINGGNHSFFWLEFRGGSRGGTATVSLNGGVSGLLQPVKNDPMSLAGDGPNFLNFNGGVLKATGGWTYSTDPVWSYALQANPAVIRDGGAIFDMANNGDIQCALRHSPYEGDAEIDGGLIKNGARNLRLMSTNTYTGATVVNAGTLIYHTTSETHFYPKADDTCNAITGAGTVNFNGTLIIDEHDVKNYCGEWRIIDTDTLASVTYDEATFSVALNDNTPLLKNDKGIYECVTWVFDPATGIAKNRPRPSLVVVR